MKAGGWERDGEIIERIAPSERGQRVRTERRAPEISTAQKVNWMSALFFHARSEFIF